MTPAQQSPLTSIRARLRRTPAAPTTVVSPPLPAPLPESDFRRAERLTGPRPRRPWSPTSRDPWEQASDAQEQQPVALSAGESTDGSPTEHRPTEGAPSSGTPVVHGVLAPHVTRRLQGTVEVRPVRPGAPHPTPRHAPGRGDLLVVERAALFDGVWAGTETARGTGLLHELLARIEDARSRGVTTVLVESAHHPNVGTNLVRDAVHVVVARDGHLVGDHQGLAARHRDVVAAVVRAAHPETPEDVREPG